MALKIKQRNERKVRSLPLKGGQLKHVPVIVILPMTTRIECLFVKVFGARSGQNEPHHPGGWSAVQRAEHLDKGLRRGRGPP